METVKSTSTVSVGSNIAIEKLIQDIPGGKEIDFTGVPADEYTDDVVPDGTPIILDAGSYKPLLAADKAVTLTAQKTVGFLYQPINRSEAFGSIAVMAIYREAKAPYVLNATIRDAVKGVTFI